MSALPGQVIFEAVFFALGVVAGEGDALFDQPLDGFAAVFDGKAYRFFLAQSAARNEGVGDMRFDCVGVVQYCGHTALSPIRRAVRQLALTQHRDPKRRWKVEREG